MRAQRIKQRLRVPQHGAPHFVQRVVRPHKAAAGIICVGQIDFGAEKPRRDVSGRALREHHGATPGLGEHAARRAEPIG